MKKQLLFISMFAMIGSMVAGDLGSAAQDLEGYAETILAKLSEFSEKINLNQNIDDIANEVSHQVSIELEKLPQSYFGIDLNRLKSAQIPNASTLKNIKQVIENNYDNLQKGLQVANGLLANPKMAIYLLNQLVWPKVQPYLQSDVKNAVQTALNVINQYQDDIANVAQQALPYIQTLKNKVDLFNTNVGGIENIDSIPLDQIYKALQKTFTKSDIDSIINQAHQVYPIVKKLIEDHFNDIKNAIQLIKNNADALKQQAQMLESEISKL